VPAAVAATGPSGRSAPGSRLLATQRASSSDRRTRCACCRSFCSSPATENSGTRNFIASKLWQGAGGTGARNFAQMCAGARMVKSAGAVPGRMPASLPSSNSSVAAVLSQSTAKRTLA
jgi:hypothetical protein